MPTDTRSTRDQRVREIAGDYEQRGYRVIVGPLPDQLPEFLRGYQPDLIAESPDESVVVEYKAGGRARPDGRWSELARLLRQHPGWHLELIVEGTSPEDLPVTIDLEETIRRLETGVQLEQANMPEAALLITWSAAEAAMRLASERHSLQLPDGRPGTLISRLYTDGVIEREEYDFLMRSMRARNAVAHGFRDGGVEPESIEHLRHVAQRLLPGSRTTRRRNAR